MLSSHEANGRVQRLDHRLAGIGRRNRYATPSTLTFENPPHSTLAKNIALAGVKSVTLYDPEPVTIQDLSSQVRGVSPH